MDCPDVITLTQKLLSFDTVNPPGNEEELAKYVGRLLESHSFLVSYYEYEKDRLHLLAEKGVDGDGAPLVLSGHFDTVPLGEKPWRMDPYAGEIEGDRIYGRGSSDMKGGLAAMTVAAIESTRISTPAGGIRLIFSSGEEMGCHGINQLVSSGKDLGKARAVIVGEPTSNHPAIAHKGAIYIKATTQGKTAHSSMPELGDNAIYKAAKAIMKVEDFDLQSDADPLLGLPTINVGKMQGGMNINSVPDHAEFSIDIRTTPRSSHPKLLDGLKRELGEEIDLETLVDLHPVSNSESDPFVQRVYEICGVGEAGSPELKSLPYLTDGSVLQAYYGGVPTLILGPGEPDMAHQTDEYCSLRKLEESVDIYKNIILQKT